MEDCWLGLDGLVPKFRLAMLLDILLVMNKKNPVLSPKQTTLELGIERESIKNTILYLLCWICCSTQPYDAWHVAEYVAHVAPPHTILAR